MSRAWQFSQNRQPYNTSISDIDHLAQSGYLDHSNYTDSAPSPNNYQTEVYDPYEEYYPYLDGPAQYFPYQNESPLRGAPAPIKPQNSHWTRNNVSDSATSNRVFDTNQTYPPTGNNSSEYYQPEPELYKPPQDPYYYPPIYNQQPQIAEDFQNPQGQGQRQNVNQKNSSTRTKAKIFFFGVFAAVGTALVAALAFRMGIFR